MCRWNSFCQILILPLWFVSPPCFLVKISQILQKIIFFLKRGEEVEVKTSSWHIYVAQCLKFFRTTAYFFQVWPPSSGWKERSKLNQRPLLSLVFFHKYSNLSKYFQTVFLFARVLPLLRISAILDHIERARVQKAPKKAYFLDAELVRKTLEFST